MSVVTVLRVSRAPMAGLSAIGIFWGGFAGVLPDIKTDVGASDAALGAALILASMGAMLAMYMAPRVGAALGRAALPVLGLVLCVAFALPVAAAAASSLPMLAVAVFAMGASVSLLDITANVRISALESRRGLHLMNLNHAMYSLAFGAAALVTALARTAGADPVQILPWLALACLTLVALMIEPGHRAPPDTRAAPVPRRTPWRPILLTGGVLFAAFIGENATESWSALHIERTLGAATGEGSLGPFMLGLTMGVGRLSGQVVAARLGEGRLILWSALLGMLGALVIAVAPGKAVALVGVAVLGLGIAVIVPSANTILGRLVTEAERPHAISRAWMAGLLGFFVGPAMMGGISQLVGLRWSFVAVALVVALTVPAVIRLVQTAGPDRQARQPA